MSPIFSYVKYSEASFPMTGQYIALLLITSVIWVLLWFGYRQNKINDEIKKKLILNPFKVIKKIIAPNNLISVVRKGDKLL